MPQIDTRLDKIRSKILEPSFIEGKGLGNEINFYIFDYEPRHELKVRKHVTWLIDNLNNTKYLNRKIIEFDLYEMFLELTKKKNIYNQIFKMEDNKNKEYLYKALTSFAKTEIFLDMVKEELSDQNVIFITGVGKIYPFVRSHEILNNLQDVLDEKFPVILFYPGKYNEQDLQLFNRIKATNYYRAFRLID